MTDHDNRREVSAATVRRLIDAQFPQWADLPIRRVENDGWDNRSFRLGTDMKVRLPSASRYVAQVEKEHRWLPRLAPHLPLPIPQPLALGAPGEDYPWPWSVQSWLPGTPATPAEIVDMADFAAAIAGFLCALQRVPAHEGSPPGPHNFFRGGPLRTYDDEMRRCIGALCGDIDAAGALAVWDAALSTRWDRPPVWIHGDVAAGNLLTTDGKLSAVIDFGSCGTGDPACDLVIAWTLLSGASRDVFKARLPADSATWARARGWALWKALLVMCDNSDNPVPREQARRVVEDVVDEHRSS